MRDETPHASGCDCVACIEAQEARELRDDANEAMIYARTEPAPWRLR